MKKLTMRDRFRGVMLGTACGDALGAQVEFRPRGTFRTPTAMTGGGPHRLEPGQWTDDTSMALALADHLTADVRTSREEEYDLMSRWLDWSEGRVYSCSERGCFDIGGRTAAALREWRDTGRTLSPSKLRPYPEGNGAVMRVPPVALRWLGDDEMADSASGWQASLTHGRIAAHAARLTTLALLRLLRGDEIGTVLRHLRRHPSWDASGVRDPARLTRDEVESGGHCLDTLEASLWCLVHSDGPREAIRMAVALGSDADTTAAVTGAMAGARWGATELPTSWLRKIAWNARLTETADRLLEASGVQERDV